MADPVVLSYHDALIRKSDLELLEGRNWLNDALIAFFLEYIQREVFNADSAVLCISPEVTQLIKLGDEQELTLFLDPLGANTKDFILLPVNDNISTVSAGGTHWSLLVFHKIEGKWFHYDSQKGSNFFHARNLVRRISKFLNTSDDMIEANCTQQDNSYDCGAFVLVNALHVAEAINSGHSLGVNFGLKSAASDIRKKLNELILKIGEQSNL